jgi:hypothetical protein
LQFRALAGGARVAIRSSMRPSTEPILEYVETECDEVRIASGTLRRRFRTARGTMPQSPRSGMIVVADVARAGEFVVRDAVDQDVSDGVPVEICDGVPLEYDLDLD